MQSAAESKVLVAWDERPRRGMAEHARDTVRGGVAETPRNRRIVVPTEMRQRDRPVARRNGAAQVVETHPTLILNEPPHRRRLLGRRVPLRALHPRQPLRHERRRRLPPPLEPRTRTPRRHTAPTVSLPVPPCQPASRIPRPPPTRPAPTPPPHQTAPRYFSTTSWRGCALRMGMPPPNGGSPAGMGTLEGTV